MPFVNIVFDKLYIILYKGELVTPRTLLRRILILLIVVGLGFGLYSLGKYLLEVSQRSQNAALQQTEEQKTQTTAQARDFADNIFEVNEYTPGSYRPPNFDPFSNKYRPAPDYQEIIAASQPTDTPPTGYFLISSRKRGFGDFDRGSLMSGTVDTQFIFRASVQDKETAGDRLQVRFDFDGDKLPDTFFSRVKTARHTYDKPGIYTITMEILDGGGNIVAISRTLKVVENTEPLSFFTFSPTEGTPGTIFTFNTQKSSDSQFLRQYLEYRFDWNSDGVWDTPFERKTVWRHAFTTIGIHRITMEARDPEGLVDLTTAEIIIFENTPPIASFTVSPQTLSNGRVRYSFDASSSSDVETPLKRLLFRWDFNYTGENDIVFDTAFSTNSKTSGFYDISGQRMVRLQVKDTDGAITEIFQTLEVQGIL